MESLLKFITCGSVDDGKSTLIGHMLYDAKLIFTDQEKALEMDSRLGSCNGDLDYSLLLDGLMAEREQGITIDVAYRYFTTQKRSFIVADTPGHEEYTRNMAVGASFADLAVILVDATKGVVSQTRRHIYICNLMGIRHFVFAVNKMDLVDYNRSNYEQIMSNLQVLFTEFETDSVCGIPVSATVGDNITKTSVNMNWYEGRALLTYLEQIEITPRQSDHNKHQSFILPIQRVCRPDHRFRGFQGQVEEGEIEEGDIVTVLPNGESAAVKAIYHLNQKVNKAQTEWPVTLCLDREVDVSRGCVLVKKFQGIVSKMFVARLLWMDDEKLVPGRNYFIKIGTQSILGVIMSVSYKVDINTGMHISAKELYKNEIAVCKIALSEDAVIDRFNNSKSLGSFILIDRISNMTSACGIIEHDMRRSVNLFFQKTDVTRELRAAQKKQTPLTLWFTGLSGSGKSALANEVEKWLLSLGKHTMLLDGDNVRLGLNKNLGFAEKDRIENIRRAAEVARLMNDAGLIALTAFISPYEQDRESARTIIGKGFIEIYVSTPLDICEKRDSKGLYKKARLGQIPNFTGVNSPYEIPSNPEIKIDTSKLTLENAAGVLIEKLKKWL